MADRRGFLGTLLVVTCGGGLRAPLARVQDTLAGPARARRSGAPVTPEQFGAKGDGTTDDTRALQQALDAAGASGDTLTLRGVRYRATATLTSAKPIRITGTPGATILKDHGGAGLLIAPTALATGAIASATADAVKITGGSWADGQFLNAWVEIGKPEQRRVVTGHQGGTLTLDHGLDTVPPAGTAFSVFAALPFVECRQFAVNSPDHAPRADRRDRAPRGEEGARKGGLTNMHIVFADNVVIENCGAHMSGVDGLKIDMARGVRIDGGEFSANGSFGLLVYHSENVAITRVQAHDNTGDYNIEVKDCRNATATACDTAGGRTGVGLYASSLNPTHDCAIVSCQSRDGTFPGFIATSQSNEGTTYPAEGYRIRDCTATGHQVGFAANQAGVQRLTVTFDGCTSTGARGAGFNLNAPAVTLRNCRSQRSGGEGFRVQKGGCTLDGCTSEDDRYQGREPGAAVEIEADVNGTTVRGMLVRRTTPDAHVSRPLEEMPGANGTVIETLSVEDVAGSMTRAPLLRGATSRGP